MARGLSATEFAIDLKKFGKLTREEATLIFRKIALELDQRIVLATPVDSGRARGNWYPSIGAPSVEVSLNHFDPSGAGAVASASAVIAGAQLGTVVWLTNNLPYILALENGHSRQAPQGMVDLNLEAVAAKYGGSIIR